MNAHSQIFELTMEGQQVDEAVASIFHTVLFHRSLGKFTYNTDSSYAVGTVGYADVDCDFIDLTYVCCSSADLDQKLKHEISTFSAQLRGNNDGGTGMGQISLEFFERKRSRWLFAECVPWEVWTLRLELISLNSEDERAVCRTKVGEMITDKILNITEVINKHPYLPKMPNQSELEYIFDTSYEEVQPYLFKLHSSISGPSSTSSVGTTMKKLIKETLAL